METNDNLTIGGADKRQPETVRVPCRRYSRVCGYLTAVEDWNAGKQSEFADRQMFDVSAVVEGDDDAG